MRTTIRLDEDLLRQAKQRALEGGRTLTSLIEDSLRTTLSLKGASLKKQRAKLPTFRSGGILPGVDLDHTAALYDIMDGIR